MKGSLTSGYRRDRRAASRSVAAWRMAKATQARGRPWHQVADPAASLAGRKVLVTGGCGFIGSRVVDALIRARAQVLSVDLRPSAPLPWPHHSQTCDVRDSRMREVISGFAPEALVHLAAQVGVPAAVARPDLDADVNILGTINVARAAIAAGVDSFVFACSCAIYGRVDRVPVSEDDSLAPSTPYGLSKAAALGYLEYFAAEDALPATSLILGNVYGGAASRAGVIERFIDDAVSGRESVLHADGRSTRDFVHVGDVTAAVLCACSARAVGRINIGSGVETSVAQVHQMVARATGATAHPVNRPARAGDLPRMRLRIDRARDALGWSPRTSLETGIAALAAARMRWAAR